MATRWAAVANFIECGPMLRYSPISRETQG